MLRSSILSEPAKPKVYKAKTCKFCKGVFVPIKQFQNVCDYKCALGLVHRDNATKAEMERKKSVSAARKKEKAGVARRRKRKAELKTARELAPEAQAIFNRYVRIRDYGKPCISCGRMPEDKFGGAMDCGHYRTRGAASHLRFNLHNTAAQCVYCNRNRSGAQKAFEEGLILRIGINKVEALNENNKSRKFDAHYLRRIKVIFAKKTRMKERFLGLK